MNDYLTAALASAHHDELKREAGCCTPMAEHRRTMHRSLRERLAARRKPASQPSGCCA